MRRALDTLGPLVLAVARAQAARSVRGMVEAAGRVTLEKSEKRP